MIFCCTLFVVFQRIDVDVVIFVYSTVAMFLIGAQPNAYFGCGAWLYSTFEPNDLWLDMYERPLGGPVANATLDGTVYTRHFESGTWAEWDINTGDGHVYWASN
jgi:hypothetical protein